MKGLPKGHWITRYSMYRKLIDLGPLLPLRSGRALSIGDSYGLAKLLSLSPVDITHANLPEYNILDLDFPDESFDFVLCDQVLEHVEGQPQTAVDECRRVLRPGGLSIQTTCFINPIHGAPKDFWRFTPEALKLLHSDWSEIIQVEGWGNFDVWTVVKDGLRLAPIPHAKWHPLHRIAVKNDPLWPISTWIVAMK